MSTAGKKIDYALLRATEKANDQELSAAAFKWLAALPKEARPIELGRRFPRIVNRFATLWPYPNAVDAYLQELLIDQRGNRQGFPLPIAIELANLRAHFDAQAAPAAGARERASS